MRYGIDAKKIERQLKWKPSETFDSGLKKTVQWYLDNKEWWTMILDGSYRLKRSSHTSERSLIHNRKK